MIYQFLNNIIIQIPFVPTNPNTYPGLGVGNLCNLNAFYPYWCVKSLLKSLGKLIIIIALKGHLLTQRAQPIHKAIYCIN